MTKEQLELYNSYLNIRRSYKQIKALVVQAGIIKLDPKDSLSTEISPYKIIDMINDDFLANVYDRNRKLNNSFARKAAAFLIRKHTRLSLNEIAPLIKVKDHTSVIYNNKACQDLMDTEFWFREKIEKLDDKLINLAIYLETNN